MSISNSPLQRIAIILDMKQEPHSIVKALKMQAIDSIILGIPKKLKLDVYKSTLKNYEIYLIKNAKEPVKGIDRAETQTAFFTSMVAIQVLKPDTLISAGSAVGLKDAQIGDIYVSDHAFVYYSQVASLAKFGEDKAAYFPYLPLSLIAKATSLKPGKIATINSWDTTSKDLSKLNNLNVDVVDTEAAMVAEAAQIFNVRMIAVKAVTHVDKHKYVDSTENYKFAENNLAEKIHLLLLKIIGKKPSELTSIRLSAKL